MRQVFDQFWCVFVDPRREIARAGRERSHLRLQVQHAAALGTDAQSRISPVGGRAPYFLLFEAGEGLVGTVVNDYSDHRKTAGTLERGSNGNEQFGCRCTEGYNCQSNNQWRHIQFFGQANRAAYQRVATNNKQREPCN